MTGNQPSLVADMLVGATALLRLMSQPKMRIRYSSARRSRLAYSPGWAAAGEGESGASHGGAGAVAARRLVGTLTAGAISRVGAGAAGSTFGSMYSSADRALINAAANARSLQSNCSPGRYFRPPKVRCRLATSIIGRLSLSETEQAGALKPRPSPSALSVFREADIL